MKRILIGLLSLLIGASVLVWGFKDRIIVAAEKKAAQEIIQDRFPTTKLPEIPALPPIPLPETGSMEKPKAVPTHRVVTHKAPVPVVVPVPAPRPHQIKRKAPKPAPLPPKDEEQLPPQQGAICIFPFNMIPHCTPQQAG